MPRIAILECDLRDDTIDWHEFANSIRSDAEIDPRESRRPADDDEWEDEDDYGDDRDRD